MDDFVRNLLTDWGLKDYIEKFKGQEIGKNSIFYLKDKDIEGLFDKTGPKVIFREELKSLKETRNAPSQVLTISNTGDQGRKRAAPQEEASRLLTPTKKQRQNTADKEKIILSKVIDTMKLVCDKLTKSADSTLNTFLQEKIKNSKIEKRELVGVFGRMGAGKSSLINAVIGEKDLLPTPRGRTGTTVMIKVEANTENLKYKAEIKFIDAEVWEQDLWYLLTFVTKDEKHQEHNETVKWLSALCGKEREKIFNQNIPLTDRAKIANRAIGDVCGKKEEVLCDSAKDLSQKLVRFTRTSSNEEDKDKCLWPLVECVTVKVPKDDFLQHVTLVDLPGTGDHNKDRDNMWKKVVGDCSTVWIVADMNRGTSEKEPWEILENACNLMGNGGQCQEIHFICTKSDVVEDDDELSEEEVRAVISDQNSQAKSEVNRSFGDLNIVNRHFSERCFKVFTVSSKEFLKSKYLEQDETEIPKLQEYLQNLSDCHSETLNYVSEAKGILSLIQGARQREVAGTKMTVCKVIEDNLRGGRENVEKSMQETSQAFQKCLDEGVKNSKISCKKTMESLLHEEDARGFHKTLSSLVRKNGVHKTTKGERINLNKKLASWLTDSIDEKFRKTFPNDSKCEPFNGAISSFSLGTEELIERNKNVELQLTYLKTEEEKLKTGLNKTIRIRKKDIYNSLMTSIEKTMQPCYDDAKKYDGEGSFKKMKNTIMDYVDSKKKDMFATAGDEMMKKLEELKEDILETLQKTMQKSIDLSLMTEDESLPDVSKELKAVTEYYDQLKKSSDSETSAVCNDLPGPSSA